MRTAFPAGFTWEVATASHQIEGAVKEGGNRRPTSSERVPPGPYGFSKKLGLVYLDPARQRRIPRSSARWYAGVARDNALPRR